MSINSKVSDNSLVISSGHKYLMIVMTSVVVTSFFVGPITLLDSYDPNGAWSWLTVVIFIIALESSVVEWWLSSSNPRISHGWYRISEIILLFFLLRFVFWSIDGESLGLARVQEIMLSPLLIFDPRFLIGFVLVLFAWNMSSRFSGNLAELILTQVEVEYYSRPKDAGELSRFDIAPKYRDVTAQNYVQRWLFGGAFLILFTVLTTFDLNGAGTPAFHIRTIGRLGIPDGLLLALLVYFIVGLWLVGETRHQLLQARWLTSGLTVEGSFGKIWSRWTVLLLLVISVSASILPIGSSFAISRILQVLFELISRAISLLFIIFTYLVFLFLSLFRSEQAVEEFESVDIISKMPDTESLPTPTGLVSGVTTGIFWLLALTAITLSAFFVLKNRRFWIDYHPFSQIISSVVGWIRRFLSRIGDRSYLLASALDNLKAISSKRTKVAPTWRFIRLNALSRRERVRYFYLSIIHRAAKHGVERMPPVTPLEYVESFENAWPEEESSMEKLTEGFIRSRYDNRDFSPYELRQIRDAFKDIRRTLRKKKVDNAGQKEEPNDDRAEDI